MPQTIQVAPLGAASPVPFTSQSEANDARDCPLKWYAAWWLNYRQTGEESRAQRIGSLAHSITASRTTRSHTAEDDIVAVLAECHKRNYIDHDATPDYITDALQADIDAAFSAADVLTDSGVLNPSRIVAIEQRLWVPWADLAEHAGLGASPTIHPAMLRLRAGMEGTPDIVHAPDDATLFVDDYKFRQKPDLGGADPDATLPDSQGAFYKTLVRGSGLAAGREVIFRQLNVYAGPWLTVDDFLAEGSPYVTSNGIPSRDLKTLGALVKPDDYAEAYRVLVERRRVASTYARTEAGKQKSIRMATPTEDWDAKRFIETLRAWPLVQVVTHKLDNTVCLDVVRDMLSCVAALLAQADAGYTPGRNLRTYERSPCRRPYGCDIQSPCVSSLGTGNVSRTLADMASDGRLHLRTLPTGNIGDRDVEAAR